MGNPSWRIMRYGIIFIPSLLDWLHFKNGMEFNVEFNFSCFGGQKPASCGFQETAEFQMQASKDLFVAP